MLLPLAALRNESVYILRGYGASSLDEDSVWQFSAWSDAQFTVLAALALLLAAAGLADRLDRAGRVLLVPSCGAASALAFLLAGLWRYQDSRTWPCSRSWRRAL